MTRRNLNSIQKNKPTVSSSSGSAKAHKWETLMGWPAEHQYDSYCVDIEAWSKRRHTRDTHTAWVDYLCSTDHICDGILDWKSFIETSLESHNEDEVKQEIFELDIQEHTPICENKELSNETITVQCTENNGPLLEQNNTIYNKRAQHVYERNDRESDSKSVKKQRPSSSNSLPDTTTFVRKLPRRHALSANDNYIYPIDLPNNIVKFSYTGSSTISATATTENTADETTSSMRVETSPENRMEHLVKYNLLHLKMGYVLPNSTQVSIGDLLHTNPRIERHIKCAQERDVVFAALANDKVSIVLPEMPTQIMCTHKMNDKLTCLPQVTQKNVTSKTKDESSSLGHHSEHNATSSMSRIPLLIYRSSDEEMSMHQMDVETEDAATNVNTPSDDYTFHSTPSDIDLNYRYRPKPRGPPAFRPSVSKTPLHRAIETGQKKLHGPHHYLFSQSSSKLMDVKVPERRRWSSSIRKSDDPDINTRRQDLDSQMRYQRLTLSRRKKSQLRIGDKMYSVGNVHSASTSQRR